MADENAIIEENEQNVGEYDPNPYDNVTVEEALKQLFNRFTPRTVRQAIFTMAENNKPATLVDKSITENGAYNASDDNADGYSKVTVDVAGGGGETFEVQMTFTVDSTHPDVLNVEVDKTFSETISAIDNGYIINFNITRINGQQTTKSIVYGYKKFLAGDIPFINIMAGSSDGGTVFIVVWVNDSTTATSGNPMPSIVIGTPET